MNSTQMYISAKLMRSDDNLFLQMFCFLSLLHFFSLLNPTLPKCIFHGKEARFSVIVNGQNQVGNIHLCEDTILILGDSHHLVSLVGEA